MSQNYYRIRVETKPNIITTGPNDTSREGTIHAINIDEIKTGIYSLLFDLYIDDAIVTKLAEVGLGLYNNPLFYSFNFRRSLSIDNTLISITISSV